MGKIEKKNLKKLPVSTFYDGRKEFVIIGLTGATGSGCSTLASYMEKGDFYSDTTIVRSPNDLTIGKVETLVNSELFVKGQQTTNELVNSQLIFKRKYQICHRFIAKNYKPYKVIKYTNVLWLFLLLYLKNNFKDFDEFKKEMVKILRNFYRPSNGNRDEDYRNKIGYKEENFIPDDFFDTIFQQSIFDMIPDVESFIDARDDDAGDIYEFFFGESFHDFIINVSKELAVKNYYCLCFFYHRLAHVLRALGEPYKTSTTQDDCGHIYDVAKLINVIIKGKRFIDDQIKDDKDVDENSLGCRIVIDAIRNSLEALFFKERYTSFYLIAVHDDENRENHFKKKVSKYLKPEEGEISDLAFKGIKHLAKTEIANKDYEGGNFTSPNISQCIADAEIHIINRPNKNQYATNFYSMAEQWMKYASLILHPGLITPSAEERCMVVAYTAKFNSGCLSRQVGAVITNKYHSIRTIGWNDVPYGQTPCGLRNIHDFIHRNAVDNEFYNYMYSNFERSTQPHYDKKYSFGDKVNKDYGKINFDDANLEGLPFPYCFKTLENRYSGEKNQVFTRSLHAEENAMLQMVKFGGESLMDGIIYVTASPCELCAKKLYQVGVRRIVYIDPYPGISREHIVRNGYKQPELQLFQGAYGQTYFKLYQPFMSLKDELSIRTNNLHKPMTTSVDLLGMIIEKIGKSADQKSFTKEEVDDILYKLKLTSN